jgi:uncharacterized membrane protein (UPF0127 family)
MSLEERINKSQNSFFIRIKKSLVGKAVVYGLATTLKFGGGYVLIGCHDENNFVKTDVVRVIFDNVWVNSEIVDTPEERARGLMFHHTLSEKEGILFIYDSEGIYKFWMKNVFFPIDILWFDSDLSIVYIKRNAPPCTTVRCQIYTPPVTAKYVLEVMANFTAKYEIKVGDRAEIIW